MATTKNEAIARLREVLRAATWHTEFIRVRQEDLRAVLEHECLPLLVDYYTVRIPFSERPTMWHPTENTGPFAVLTRGAFRDENEAHEWAREHLGYAPVFEVRHVVDGVMLDK